MIAAADERRPSARVPASRSQANTPEAVTVLTVDADGCRRQPRARAAGAGRRRRARASPAASLPAGSSACARQRAATPTSPPPARSRTRGTALALADARRTADRGGARRALASGLAARTLRAASAPEPRGRPVRVRAPGGARARGRRSTRSSTCAGRWRSTSRSAACSRASPTSPPTTSSCGRSRLLDRAADARSCPAALRRALSVSARAAAARPTRACSRWRSRRRAGPAGALCGDDRRARARRRRHGHAGPHPRADPRARAHRQRCELRLLVRDERIDRETLRAAAAGCRAPRCWPPRSSTRARRGAPSFTARSRPSRRATSRSRWRSASASCSASST